MWEIQERVLALMSFLETGHPEPAPLHPVWVMDSRNGIARPFMEQAARSCRAGRQREAKKSSSSSPSLPSSPGDVPIAFAAHFAWMVLVRCSGTRCLLETPAACNSHRTTEREEGRRTRGREGGRDEGQNQLSFSLKRQRPLNT